MEFEIQVGQAPDGTDIRKNFADWFGASVASLNGAPIVFYHGSNEKFNFFDMEKSLDGAHFFTTEEDHAATFGAVGAYYLAIQNPFVIHEDDLDAAWDEEHPDGMQDDRYLLPRDFVEKFVKIGKEKGHDGLIVRDMGDRDVSTDMYLPFSASQIKSAENNNGLFDKDCPDFTDATSIRMLDLKERTQKKIGPR